MAPTQINPSLLVWGADIIEPNTIEQAERTARLPIVAGHVALMPDAHVGMGSTVGSVIPTEGAVIPSAIGVDIGCGMIAARTQYTSAALPDNMGPLHGALRDAVPAGLGKWGDERGPGDKWIQNHARPLPPMLAESNNFYKRTCAQFGSLGSGNHFLEICLDEQDRVWLVLHSGSRGVGNKLAQHHIAVAEELADLNALEDPALASLSEDLPEFDAYIADMLWAQDYAAANRALMLENVLRAFNNTLDRCTILNDVVNCHHNFTEREAHGGRLLWITRKGAIRARRGDRGVIPGSMATGSYIVTGLGNEASWESCSHGAGRVRSRGAARRELTVESLIERMGSRTWNERDAESLVDEHPDAYKRIEDVMAAQSDLVRVEHTLTQVLNVKGTDGGRRRKHK